MPDHLFPTEKGEGLSDRTVLILIVSVMLIPGLLWVLTVPYNPGDRARVEQLRRLAAELPVYPDFKELSSYGGVKSGHARFTVNYDVPAYSPGFEAVKKFYLEALTPQGWSLSEEEVGRAVRFRKGEYDISIRYNDEREAGWDYSVTYGRRV